jgi:4-amino-4-deoxy-L-arabinose transferase-like glycosyltransferase
MPVKAPQKSPHRLLSRELVTVSSLFCLAFVIRLIYLLQIRSSPFFTTPVTDPGWHDAWAMEIARGDWVGQVVFFRAPLYPYFLGVLYSLFGHDYFMARLVQILLGSISCVMIYLLARTLFDKKIGLVSGIIMSSYGVLIYFDAELLIPVLIVFLDLLLLWLLVRRVEALSFRDWALAGLVMGFSALARPNILIFIPFLLFWLWLMTDLKRRRRAVSCALIFLLAIICVILPVAVRNYMVGGDIVFISSQAGVNFYIGNAGDADGKIAGPPGGVRHEDSHKDNVWAASERVAQQAMGRPLKPSQISSYWFGKAMREIGEHPWRYIGLLAKKFYFFWNGHEIESNQSIYTSRQWSSLLRVLVWKRIFSFPSGLLIPFAGLGFILTGKNWKKHLLLHLFVFSYMLSVVVFFVNFRFRVPVIPILIVYASYAGVWCGQRVRSREWRTLAAATLVFLGIFVFANSTLFGVAQVNVAREHYLQALVYTEKGMLMEAAEHYRKCLSLDPYMEPAHYNLAKIYRLWGQLDAAILEFQRVLALQPDFIEGHNGLGITYAQKGAHDLAIQEFHIVLNLEPDHGWARLNLANVYFEKGLLDSALLQYHRAEKLLPDVSYIRQQIEKIEDTPGP